MDNGIVQEEKTSISSSTSIVGNIKAQEHLIINGTIKGNIEIRDFNLFIGPSGKVEGEAHAKNVRIRGQVKGKIYAKGKVEITRFKGLGEISPDEFKHFIGEDIRLDPVMLDKEKSIEELESMPITLTP